MAYLPLLKNNNNCLRCTSSVVIQKKLESLSYYYSNKLNKIKELSKQKYLSTQCDINEDDIKMTWKLIGLIMNMKKESNLRLNKLLFRVQRKLVLRLAIRASCC